MVEKENILNLPNSITFIRLLLAPIIVLLILSNQNILAFLVYLITLISDIDGFIARKINKETHFGEVFDAIADNIVILSILITLVAIGRMHLWILVVLVVFGLICEIPSLYTMIKYKKLGVIKSPKITKLAGLIIAASVALYILNIQYKEIVMRFSIFIGLLATIYYSSITIKFLKNVKNEEIKN